MHTFNLLVALFALLQCARYGRRALLFLAPSVRVDAAPGEAPGSARRLRVRDELSGLGFDHLGVLRERGALGAWASERDTYASADRAAFADVEDLPGEGPGVVFFTPFADGAAVLTASFPRRPVSSDTVQVGGMPGVSLAALLSAHEVAVQRFAARHGAPQVAPTLPARVTAARSWHAGEGRREVRRAHATAFGIVVVALVLLASSVNILLHGR